MKKPLEIARSVVEQLELKPTASAREIALALKLTHPTVGPYLKKIKACGVPIADLVVMTDFELYQQLQLQVCSNFIEPDFDKVLKFVNGAGSNPKKRTHTVEEAYVELYLKVYFSEHLTVDARGNTCFKDKKPDNCMSETTFKRRYASHIALLAGRFADDKTSICPSLNECGPGGCMYLDGVGDKLQWIDANNDVHTARILCAILGYSTLLFAIVVEQCRKQEWMKLIEDFFYEINGTVTSVKTDNDSCVAHRVVTSKKNGDTHYYYVPHVEFRIMGRQYHFEFLLANVGAYRDKANMERHVNIIEHLVLELPKVNGYVYARDFDELCVLVKQKVDEFNRRVLPKLGMSRQEFFEKYEAPYLQPLPPAELRMTRKTPMKCVLIGTRGYARYEHDDYYLGIEHRGRRVLCSESEGKVFFNDYVSNYLYASYDKPTDISIKIRRFKHREFMTPAEKYVTRTLEDFLRQAELEPLIKDELSAVCTRIFETKGISDVDKTNLCNNILKICRAHELCADVIKQTLQALLKRPGINASDFKYLLVEALKDADSGDDQPTGPGSGLRGADYYADDADDDENNGEQ